MATKVLVPRLGEGVDELTIVRWLKAEGQAVQELESLVEVETDKVITEIPSPASGTLLRILAAENTPARVGETMAWIGQPGESLPGSSAPVSTEPVSRVPEPTDTGTRDSSTQVTSTRETGFLSPVVRKLAAERKVDLAQVRGTGLNGRITKQDVLAYLEGGQGTAPASPRVSNALPGKLIPVTPVRRQIAERMQQSKQTSPHVMTVMEADMSRVAAHRAANKESFARDGVNLTFTAYFIAAIASGLKAYPMTNSSWTDEGVLVHKSVNIGMATSLGEEGLIVPVIKSADGLSLLGVARAVNDLSSRARAKKLQPDEVKGGTFTLTNHGVSNSLFAMPIINQPQCGILGVGAMQKRAVVVTDANGGDSIAIRLMVYLSFVFDHRILDGASADWFLMKVKETLENWQ